jgi:diguanylate cyclase (GGDEF)-like protein
MNMRLQAKILLFLAPAILIAMLTLGWVAYIQLRDFSEEKTFYQMTTLLDQIQHHTWSRLAMAKAHVELLANSELLKRYLLSVEQDESFRLTQKSLRNLFDDYRSAFPDYAEISLFLPDGYEAIRSTDRVRHNVKWPNNRRDFQAMQPANANLYTTVFRDSNNETTHLLIGKVIYLSQAAASNSRSAEPQGYLMITTTLDFLEEQVRENQIGKTGYLLLADRQGNVIFGNEKGQTYPVLSQDLLDRVLTSTTHQEVLRTNLLNKSVLIQIAALPGNMFLLAVMPEAEFLLASRNLAVSVATVMFIAMLVTTILLFLILRALVINPINKLSKVAQAIGAGKFPHGLDIRRADEIGSLANAFKDMSEKLQHSNAQISHLAYHDSLTGLPNRRMFLDYVERALSHARRYNKTFALLFLDLDNFKQVNDTVGHDAGDQLLREVAERLTTCIRAEDYVARGETDLDNTVARLGGDEFIILLPNISHSYQAAKVADRIVHALVKPIIIRQKEFYISTSIGITAYPEDGTDVDSLVKNADIAMYRAKHQGKNTYQHYTESMHQHMLDRLNLERALRKAVERNEFELHYQPQVDIRNGKVLGVEALLRWRQPDKGLLVPHAFIGLAEQTGLIEPIGEWVLKEACQQGRIWQDLGFSTIQVAVNIALCQFRKGKLEDLIKRVLAEADLAPHRLTIELTETSIIDVQASALETLIALKDQGVHISLDKFGSGYSSLGALRSFPIDTVKIDRRFIQGIDQSEDDAAIIMAVIAMSCSLNLRVIAEGVETENQLTCLRNNGCTVVQGYLISKPLTADEMTAFMLKSTDPAIYSSKAIAAKNFHA